MAFSRDQLTARHAFATQPVALSAPQSLATPLAFENAGNWHMAGEAYSQLEERIGEHLDVETRAKVLARAATCFEIANQPRPASRAYADAARLLSQNSLRPQTAGELFSRSAHQHILASEFFFAGSNWRAAAVEFRKLGTAVILSLDSIPPVPVSAAGHTVTGSCLIAAGDAFVLASGQEVWACGAYWEAGNALAKTFPSPNIQTYDAYRQALNAVIRFYGTLELAPLRRSLPLTEEERAANLDPLRTLENAAFRCNHHHQPPTAEPRRSAVAQLETDRQLAAAFHKFSLLFASDANTREAGIYRAAEKERLRRIAWAEQRFGSWMLYSFWKVTSGYGESLARWAGASVIALAAFALMYFMFDAISPVTARFDYIYFSVITFTSLGYGDIHPKGTVGKILACAEITIGLVMFGVLLSFLGNRLQKT